MRLCPFHQKSGGSGELQYSSCCESSLSASCGCAQSRLWSSAYCECQSELKPD